MPTLRTLAPARLAQALPLLYHFTLSHDTHQPLAPCSLTVDSTPVPRTSPVVPSLLLLLLLCCPQVLYLGFNRISDIAALCLERMPRLLAVDLQVRHSLLGREYSLDTIGCTRSAPR